MFPHQKLNKYLKLQSLIKRLEAEKERLRLEIMVGTDFPSTYSVTITKFTSRRIESLEAIRDKSQNLYDALFTAGCVRESEHTRVLVKRNDQ